MPPTRPSTDASGTKCRVFEAASDNDVVTLVDEHPLAWMFLADDDGPFATAAPVRPALVDGRLAKLVGHVPRGRRTAACLSRPARALILFLGPHGYVSPSWMSDRTQAPTWNFTSVQFDTEARLVDDPQALEYHLRDLTASLERSREAAWNVDEMGPRFERLAARVVAFEARILGSENRFKLGQDENDQTFREIADGLEQEGSAALLRWMRKYNAFRD